MSERIDRFEVLYDTLLLSFHFARIHQKYHVQREEADQRRGYLKTRLPLTPVHDFQDLIDFQVFRPKTRSERIPEARDLC